MQEILLISLLRVKGMLKRGLDETSTYTYIYVTHQHYDNLVRNIYNYQVFWEEMAIF